MLLTKSRQVFLFEIILEAIKSRFEIISNFGFFFQTFFMRLILMKQFSFLFCFVFIVFFVLAECLLESWDMLFEFYVMLFNLFFNCSCFINFLFDCFQGLIFRFRVFGSFFTFRFFLPTLFCFFLFLFLLDNFLNLNFLLNILNLLSHTCRIHRNIHIDILNLSNMNRAHHKLDEQVRATSYVVIFVFFLPIE